MTCPFVAPRVKAVCTRSSGTRRMASTTAGSRYTTVPRKRKATFWVSSMPNQRISSGMNAVMGR